MLNSMTTELSAKDRRKHNLHRQKYKQGTHFSLTCIQGMQRVEKFPRTLKTKWSRHHS